MGNEMQLTDERILKLNLIQEDLRSSRSGKLYVFGASANARVITSFITNNSDLSAEAYVLDDAYFTEETFLEKPVLKLSVFLNIVTENDWIIINNLKDQRAKELQKEMPSFVRLAYLHVPYSTDGVWLNIPFYQQHKKLYENVRGILSDDISKQTMDAFTKGCITGNTEDLYGLHPNAEGQYFNELTSSCKPGCFVDCGAYTGDTIKSAFDFLGDRIERIIAFEPDSANMIRLKEQMKEIGLAADKVKLLQKGSYDKAAMLRFKSTSTGLGSAIAEDGDVAIETETLDNAASDMGTVAFIKMDIEGSELKSLLGAANTIRKYHPILAICAYHRPEDLFELPEAIRKITGDSGYRYYLRYHGPGLLELVLYAIPVD